MTREQSKTPHWPDGCCHVDGGGRFVGTVYDAETGAPVDVYLYDSGPPFGTELCLRYGAAAWEYRSAGPVAAWIERATQGETAQPATDGRVVELLRGVDL